MTLLAATAKHYELSAKWKIFAVKPVACRYLPSCVESGLLLVKMGRALERRSLLLPLSVRRTRALSLSEV